MSLVLDIGENVPDIVNMAPRKRPRREDDDDDDDDEDIIAVENASSSLRQEMVSGLGLVFLTSISGGQAIFEEILLIKFD